MMISIAKSAFCCKKVKFLGHIISPSEIAADPDKISAISDFGVYVTIICVSVFCIVR